MNDVYVFGDSHWRVFFPFVNHGAATDNVSHEQGGVRTIDTIANELSGSTMYGLLNPNSRNGARNRILSTIDKLGGVQNVGLVFGEVDARFHNGRYFHGDKICHGRIQELVSRYVRFVQEDLIFSGRVKGKIFIYHGFDYPKMGDTLLQPNQSAGDHGYLRATMVNHAVRAALSYGAFNDVLNVHPILNYNPIVSDDGVHLECEKTYPDVLDAMKRVFENPHCQERDAL